MVGTIGASSKSKPFATLSGRFRNPTGKNLQLASLLVLSAVFFLAGSDAAIAQRNSKSAPSVVEPGAPGEPSKILPPSTHPAALRLSQADVAFMQGMIMHHSQAVEMTALIPSHTADQYPLP